MFGSDCRELVVEDIGRRLDRFLAIIHIVSACLEFFFVFGMYRALCVLYSVLSTGCGPYLRRLSMSPERDTVSNSWTKKTRTRRIQFVYCPLRVLSTGSFSRRSICCKIVVFPVLGRPMIRSRIWFPRWRSLSDWDNCFCTCLSRSCSSVCEEHAQPITQDLRSL